MNLSATKIYWLVPLARVAIFSVLATVSVVPSTQAQVREGEPCFGGLDCTVTTVDGLATKISGLDIGGLNYNVEFIFDSFENIFGDPNSPDFNRPTFWLDETGAKNASDQIILALGEGNVIPRPYATTDFEGTLFDAVSVPFDIASSLREEISFFEDEVPDPDFDGNSITNAFPLRRGPDQPYAKFTQVPEPSSLLAMFVFGGAGLAAAYKKHSSS